MVKRITPTNRQEVLSDLSDPGLEGAIMLEFSERLDPETVLDAQNAFNGLTSDVNVLNSAFVRVAGFPIIGGPVGNVLTFYPAGGWLPDGQYTITVMRDVESAQGGRLNEGRFDFRSSFTVGADIWKPQIRDLFPAPGQTEVPKHSDIIITWNETLNPLTVTNSTLVVAYGNPLVQVNGTVKTARDDFETIFTPDPANPLPPNQTITVLIIGGASGIADMVGNTFDADNDPSNTVDSLAYTFQTVTEPPPPNNVQSVVLGQSIASSDCSVYYATTTKVGVIRGQPWYSNWNDFTLWGSGNPIPNSETVIGRPEEIIVDPRFSPNDGHTWIYVIDRNSRSVVIYGSRDSRIVHRWRDLPDPRGLAVAPSGLTLYVTNYSADSLSFIDIGSVTTGDAAATQAVKDLSKLGNPNDPNAVGTRRDVQVGRGPLGAAHAPDTSLVFVANNIDNSCTLVATATATVGTTFPIGTSPQDVAATFNFPGIGRFAFITCLGGGTDDNGSVSLYWSSPNGLQANITGFKNPKGLIYNRGADAWIANSGGNTVARLTLAFAGGGFAATILPQISASVTVGKNPSDVSMEPVSFFFGAPTRCIISADRGSSQLSFIDAAQPSRPIYSLMIPGVHQVAAYFDQ